MIANLHGTRTHKDGKKTRVQLMIATNDDGVLDLDFVNPGPPSNCLMSIRLNPDAAATLRNVLLDKLPIRRTLSELLALSDPID